MPTTSVSANLLPGVESRERWRRLRKFFFPRESGEWLAILRIGLGLEVVLYSLSLYRDWERMFGKANSGFLNREFTEALLSIQSPLVPRIGWLLAIGQSLGLNEQTTLTAVWVLFFAAGVVLMVGLFSRSAAIVAWLLHLCAAKTGGYLAYGVDNFLTIGLFYLMLAPLPDVRALDQKFWRKRTADPELVGFCRRVLQLHLCVIYFFGGLTKCLGAGWWNGDSMWRALIRPPFDLIPSQTLMQWQAVLLVTGIMVCLLEVGFPILIWPKKTRVICLAAIIGMHVGIGLTMGLYLFSLVMIVLNLAAFGPGGVRTGLGSHLANPRRLACSPESQGI